MCGDPTGEAVDASPRCSRQCSSSARPSRRRPRTPPSPKASSTVSGRRPSGSATRGDIVREIDRGLAPLGCGSSCLARLEPTRGEYSPIELARLDALVGSLHAAGVKVILTTVSMPIWATDSYWWSHPPAGYAEGPQPFYPIRSDAAWRLRRPGRVPRSPISGQRPGARVLERAQSLDVPLSAAHCGRPVLRRPSLPPHAQGVHAGVTRAQTGQRIIAGATAPVGLNDCYRTSPQRFARFMKARRRRPLLRRLFAPPVHARRLSLHGARPAAERHFHHGHAVQPADAAAPVPGQALLPHRVRLQHEAQHAFGGFAVSEATQARYLRPPTSTRAATAKSSCWSGASSAM